VGHAWLLEKEVNRAAVWSWAETKEFQAKNGKGEKSGWQLLI
jgi:hypothetical protein